MVALSRNVSNKHAMEMLLTGDMTSAARAAEIGLVNRVLSEDMLQAAVLEMAGKIASKSSMTLATGKRAFYAQREMSLSQAYDYASQVMVDNMMARDAEEGIGAFIEKRQPRWQDA
jgi:enoyl-CoA hydratase/carnithine racemase